MRLFSGKLGAALLLLFSVHAPVQAQVSQDTLTSLTENLMDGFNDLSGCAVLEIVHNQVQKKFSQFDFKVEALRVILENSADKGATPAQAFLGITNLIGIFTPQNLPVAAQWLRKAAVHDYLPAQFLLGRVYKCGWGVKEDSAAYQSWMQKAADQNYARAQMEVGLWYMEGQVQPKNEKLGLEWISKAAHQGLGAAQYQMALAYMAGTGVNIDPKQTAFWAQLAIQNGFGSGAMLNIMADDVPPADLEKIKEKAQICMDSNYIDCAP